MNDTMTAQAQAADIANGAPDWARGCEDCKYGVVMAPELTGAVSLYLERLVQMLDKEIVFCQCRAGVRYEAALKNRHQALIEEARASGQMLEAARHNTHVDIWNARNAILNETERRAEAQEGPTVRYEGDA